MPLSEEVMNQKILFVSALSMHSSTVLSSIVTICLISASNLPIVWGLSIIVDKTKILEYQTFTGSKKKQEKQKSSKKAKETN